MPGRLRRGRGGERRAEERGVGTEWSEGRTGKREGVGGGEGRRPRTGALVWKESITVVVSLYLLLIIITIIIIKLLLYYYYYFCREDMAVVGGVYLCRCIWRYAEFCGVIQ